MTAESIQQNSPGTEITPDRSYAAIDLGSNSFHMAVASATDSHLTKP